MNRFDMENELINLSKISDDIKTIAGQVIDGTLDRDDVFAALHGLAILHDARYSAAWDTFLQVFKLDEYADLEENSENDEDIINECNACENYIKDVFAKYDYSENKPVSY